MYRLSDATESNLHPWNTGFQSRANKLVGASQAGKQTVVILSDMADPSTFRYRGYNVSQALEDADNMQVVYFFTDEIDGVAAQLKHIKLVVVSRCLWTAELQQFIDAAKRFGISFIYDIDDLVYDIDYIQMLTNSINIDLSVKEMRDTWINKIARADFMARQADGFTSTNSFLCEMLETKYQKSSRVIPNFFNQEQLDVSNKLRKEKSRAKAGSVFTLGYFSGSPSHIKDLELATPELVMLMEEFEDIRLNIAGHMQFTNEKMNDLLLKGRVRRLPFVNFIELQKFVAEVDVNIVPLVLNTFTHCKSELKYFEAALVDTITVASPSFTFKNAITHGENGFLCQQGEWYKTIKDIYQGRVDAATIVQNAHRHTLQNYGKECVKKQIEEAYNFFINKIKP